MAAFKRRLTTSERQKWGASTMVRYCTVWDCY